MNVVVGVDAHKKSHTLGWYACHNRAIGISTTAMGVSSVVAQWALADLCPNGCSQGCLHP